MTSDSQILHATCVAIDGRGVLIIGPSGSGKSALALQLIALGALLISDDQTTVTQDGPELVATAPDAIKGMIEARGVGILRLPPRDQAPLCLVVDMSQTQEKRLPDPQEHRIMDVVLPCLHKIEGLHFPSALLLYMKHYGDLET